MSRSVLFLGGTGTISAACARRAVEAGWDVTVLNRGRTTTRPVPDGAEMLVADLQDPAAVDDALAGRSFDAVCQFLAFTPDQVEADIARFRGRTGQYVFISSASAYQTPPTHLPVTESTPLRNPFWQYSRDKIACEDALVRAYRDDAFPMTIVRPSHTYDRTRSPIGPVRLRRLLDGREVMVHGDGSSLWTVTHADDFAIGFTGVLGLPAAIGEPFHITSHEAPTWDAIVGQLSAAAGIEADIVHVPSDAIAAASPDGGASYLGDKTHSMVFDTSKLRSLVPDFVCRIPFAEGARQIVEWHRADPDRLRADAEEDARIDALIARYRVER